MKIWLVVFLRKKTPANRWLQALVGTLFSHSAETIHGSVVSDSDIFI